MQRPPDRSTVGLMVFQEMIRSEPDAVGLKPSAMGSEAHLRGLYRIHCWKTISPRLRVAKAACAASSRRRRPASPTGAGPLTATPES
ncbi:hypothetical protein [Candidatus Chloroploca sp. Khr17]|uniref:hypothetical protein n=1 Tax=Candidatus Chloroploca sp. Khr17 TaxID=2496869 RepID=UPI00101BAB9B|nr:hypothetical protein [Candidatus Chloroploca sp. Khr17]